jgi:IS30 family transposase
MIGTARGESIRSIAHRLGRNPTTILREIANNGAARGLTGRQLLASSASTLSAGKRACRPSPTTGQGHGAPMRGW